MKREDLSPVMQQAYDALPTEESKEEFLRQQTSIHNQMMRGAIAQVQARNNSHNVGTHIGRVNK